MPQSNPILPESSPHPNSALSIQPSALPLISPSPTPPLNPSSPPDSDPLLSNLSPPQLTAIQCIFKNASIPDAAKAAGKNSRTVYRWIEKDPVFSALYNAWELEKEHTGRAKAIAALEAALDVLISHVNTGSLSAAINLIKHVRTIAPKNPPLTDPDEIQRRQTIKKTRKQKRLAAAEQKLGLHIPKIPKTLAQVHEAMGPLAELHDSFILNTEDRWNHYLTFKHLSPKEYDAHYTARQRPYGQPSEPRPSWIQFLAALERQAKRYNWDLKSSISVRTDERRRAEQTAHQHENPSPSDPTPIANLKSQISNPQSQISNPPPSDPSPKPNNPDTPATASEPYTEPEDMFIPYNSDRHSIEKHR